MKKCSYNKHDLIRYISNSMSRDEETEFQHHMLQCEECAENIGNMRQMLKTAQKGKRTKYGLIVATVVGCTILGSIYFVQYSDLGGGGTEHKIIFPADDTFHNIDSIAPNDTINYDTITTIVYDDSVD